MVHQVYIENNSKMIQLKEQYEKVKKWQPLGIAAFKEFGSMKSFFYLFLGFAVLILSANLGLPPLWGSEGRWAVIARSMLRSGDLLCPALGIEYYWDKRSLSIYGFYIGMALATLAKGPMGFILPLLVSLVYLLFQKDWKAVKRMRLLTGMVLCFVIVLSWYLPVHKA